MLPNQCVPNRRSFLKAGVGMAVGLSSLAALPISSAAAENAWIVGPQPGFTPEIGTLTPMLAFTRRQVLKNVNGLSQQDLDFLLDANANTIGALLLHLAATETYYQMNTFDGMKWDSWPEEVKKSGTFPYISESQHAKQSRETVSTITSTPCIKLERRALPNFASATISG